MAHDPNIPPPAKGELSRVEPGHPIDTIANTLSDREHVRLLSASHKISPMDVAIAYANACGHILGMSVDMPRDTALGRIDDLAEVMRQAYDLKVLADGKTGFGGEGDGKQ